MFTHLTRPSRALIVVLTAAALILLAGVPASATPSGERDQGRSSVVSTQSGALRGTTIDGADAFLGVPFAAPPVKELRFAPPAPAASWQGTRDATRQAPACVQFQPGGVKETQATSEDCLYLDVYRPRGTGRSAKLPVVAWIHGGGFTQGTGVIYGGQTLATQTNSIVVSINYRVGAFGNLALPQLDTAHRATGSGNWGILER